MTDTPASEAQATPAAGQAEASPPVTAASQTETSQPVTAATAAAATTTATAAPAPATPTPVAGTPGGGESWLLAQRPEDYTLQLLATLDESLLRAYLDEHQFTEPVAYFGFRRDGKHWYAAVYGAYAGKSQAQQAVAALPPEVGKNPPWIRQFASIQKIIRKP